MAIESRRVDTTGRFTLPTLAATTAWVLFFPHSLFANLLEAV